MLKIDKYLIWVFNPVPVAAKFKVDFIPLGCDNGSSPTEEKFSASVWDRCKPSIGSY